MWNEDRSHSTDTNACEARGSGKMRALEEARAGWRKRAEDEAGAPGG